MMADGSPVVLSSPDRLCTDACVRARRVPRVGRQRLRLGRQPLPQRRVAKRWELNTVLIVNTNNRTTVGLANNTGQR